jgi:hypothetical protein
MGRPKAQPGITNVRVGRRLGGFRQLPAVAPKTPQDEDAQPDSEDANANHQVEKAAYRVRRIGFAAVDMNVEQ